jgi:hypothetical protein
MSEGKTTRLLDPAEKKLATVPQQYHSFEPSLIILKEQSAKQG